MPNEEKTYVTLSEKRYSELLRAECVFQLMEHVIFEKAAAYEGMTHREIQIYSVLFLNKEDQVEAE